MHLLHDNPVSCPEFVSLSLFMKPGYKMNYTASSNRMVEPMVLASPISTISHSNAMESIKELHSYLNSLFRSFLSNKGSNNNPPPSSSSQQQQQQQQQEQEQQQQQQQAGRQSRLEAELIQEDDRLLQEMQIFRPGCAHGVGLHYRLIRDASIIMQIASLILSSSTQGSNNNNNLNSSMNNSSASSTRSIESEVVGVVFCVGMAGLPLAHSSSSLQYGLSQKIQDCLGVLSRIGTYDVGAAKMLLSTLLIAEDEFRKSNEMADAAKLTAIPEGATEAGFWGGNLFQNTKNIFHRTGAGTATTTSMGAGTTDHDDADATASAADTSNQVTLGESSADFAREMMERFRVLSVAETDTFLKRYETSGQERKANLDLTGTKSRFRRKKAGDTNIPDLDQFDYKGPIKPTLPSTKTPSSMSFSKQHQYAQTPSFQSSLMGGGGPPSTASSKLKQPNKDSRAVIRKPVGPVPALGAPRAFGARRSSMGGGQQGGMGQQGRLTQGGGFGGHNSISFEQQPQQQQQQRFRNRRGSTGSDLRGDMALAANPMMHPDGGGAPANLPQLQVNIALNEDLTCSYKASKMTSCNVEGVLQVQTKSSARSGVPFQILLRDPSRHIQSLQENKKFADDITHAQMQHGDSEDIADSRFTVSVPQSPNYFPVLRYKCSPDLRPVPIRVQTRVKADKNQCRVALQISSNPHNEGSLTDLTIIMGVTTEIIGESLVTQPVGGVWNASKRSVIWCVSELGDGEKFQLQAKFQMNTDVPSFSKNAADPASQTPKFPVLVRCQCMYAQLTDLEVEVRDIPEVYPAEIAMKVAKRFRLSHQERS